MKKIGQDLINKLMMFVFAPKRARSGIVGDNLKKPRILMFFAGTFLNFPGYERM